MANQNFNDYMAQVQQYSNPDRYQRSNKSMAWGGLLSALLSGAAKKNLVPGYMESVGRVQERHQQERMMERMQMQDTMQVQQHDKSMRQMDAAFKLMQEKTNREQGERESYMKYMDDFMSKQNVAKTNQLKLDAQKQDMGLKAMDKMLAMNEKYGGAVSAGIGKPGASKVVGKVGEKLKAGRKDVVGKQAVQTPQAQAQLYSPEDIAYAQTSPQAGEAVLGTHGYEAPLGKMAQQDRDLRVEQAETTIDVNKGRLAEQGYTREQRGQYGGAYMDLVNNDGKFTQAWDPDMQAKALQDYNKEQEYASSQAAYRSNLYKKDDGDKSAGYVKTLSDWTDMVGDEQKDYAQIPASAIRYKNRDWLNKWVQTHADTDSMTLHMMLGKAFKESGQAMDDDGMWATAASNILTPSRDKEGNVVVGPDGQPASYEFKEVGGNTKIFRNTYDKDFRDAADQWALGSGWAKEKTMWVIPGSMTQEYYRAPDKFVDKSKAGVTPPEPEQVQPSKIKRQEGGDIVPDVTSAEWGIASQEAKDIIEQSPSAIPLILSDPSGLPDQLLDEDGNPYPPDVYEYIVYILQGKK